MAGSKSTVPVNPLVDDHAPGTVSRCRCALAWMRQVEEPGGNKDWSYGRFLLMGTIVDALEHAEQQLSARPHLEVANG